MKKLLCLGLNVFVMALALTSCGENNQNGIDSGFKPMLDTNTSCKIRVVGEWTNFDALVAEFHRFRYFYPHVSFSYKKVEDYNNQIAAKLEGTNKPNIYFTYSYMVGNSKYDPVFAHAEDLSSVQLDFDCIRESLLHKEDDGSIFMVPIFARTYGMLVNKDLFEKEELEIPTTHEEFVSVCQAFLDKGYPSPLMGYTQGSSSCLMNTVAYPLFVANLAAHPDIIPAANVPDSSAGEYTREALEAVHQIFDRGYANLEACQAITNNYDQVIFRFFEGDVPMMICAADTASGTTSRESQSEPFCANPFSYCYAPIPASDAGCYFIDSPSIEFSVNKDAENLDMANEFLRFLINEKELNEMSAVKGLVTPTKVVSFDSLYAPFGDVPAERTIAPEDLGIQDPISKQIREASYKVGKGDLSVDEAVAQYGTF